MCCCWGLLVIVAFLHVLLLNPPGFWVVAGFRHFAVQLTGVTALQTHKPEQTSKQFPTTYVNQHIAPTCQTRALYIRAHARNRQTFQRPQNHASKACTLRSCGRCSLCLTADSLPPHRWGTPPTPQKPAKSQNHPPVPADAALKGCAQQAAARQTSQPCSFTAQHRLKPSPHNGGTTQFAQQERTEQ